MRRGDFIFGCLLVACLAGCGETPSQESAALPPETEPQPLQVSDDNMAQWARSCALCHVNGEGGAPRVGNAGEWSARLSQGEEVLLAHTVEGFNNMPPLGYCMDCEEADLRALIRFMAAAQ